MELNIRGHTVELSLFSIIATPGEQLRIGLLAYSQVDLRLTLDGNPAGEKTENEWLFQAPKQPGLYQVHISRPNTNDESMINLWVTHPLIPQGAEHLNGYLLGQYPEPRPNRSNYAPPVGMIEVTASNVDTRLTTNFTLRQFVCKQDSDYPKYVVVQEGLLVLLERLLATMQSQGFDIDTFGIISGYRTPWYNQSIGNVRYSRHIYGDAMDIFIDADGDGRMDDVNKDGKRNQADIELFYDRVNSFMAQPENQRLVGGIGRYRPGSRHGGFVHVDTRGYSAHW